MKWELVCMGVKDVAARAGSLSQGIASTSRIASSCFNVSRQTLTNLEYETAGRYLSLMRRAAVGCESVQVAFDSSNVGRFHDMACFDFIVNVGDETSGPLVGLPQVSF